MQDAIVRIESITINNFKNVKHGFLSFENPRKCYAASILGLYGQNGSGKTALIDAIALLQFALRGQQIPVSFADYIHVEAEYADLKYEFRVINKETEAVYKVCYEFCIRKNPAVVSSNTELIDAVSEEYQVVIFDEVLRYSYENHEVKYKLLPVIDTRAEIPFVPKTKYDSLIGTNKAVELDLCVAKKIAFATSRSFVFSKELVQAILANCKEEWHKFLIQSLIRYGHYGLFVINTANSGLISMQALPLAFKYEGQGKEKGAVGKLALPLNEAAVIPQEAVEVVEKVIHDMNIVLQEMIPKLTISVEKLGTEIKENGKIGCRIQLMSNKNSKKIPLRDESEGIKKIISVLQLLIVVYNDSSITVAIDELDAGIFEYLLGELLRIISEKGKGQLIFTSHNLRPLETLDRGFIAFTTTNPENRYIRLNHVKTNHNLRDFYYRDIVLGEQNEPVYEPTNNYEIALAFREAGEQNGS